MNLQDNLTDQYVLEVSQSFEHRATLPKIVEDRSTARQAIEHLLNVSVIGKTLTAFYEAETKIFPKRPGAGSLAPKRTQLTRTMAYLPEKPERMVSLIFYLPLLESVKCDEHNYGSILESSAELVMMMQALRKHGVADHIILAGKEKTFHPMIEGETAIGRMDERTVGTTNGQDEFFNEPDAARDLLIDSRSGKKDLSFYDLLHPDVFTGIRGMYLPAEINRQLQELQDIFSYQSSSRPALGRVSADVKNHFAVLKAAVADRCTIILRLANVYNHQVNEMLSVVDSVEADQVVHLVTQDNLQYAILDECRQRNWGVLITKPKNLVFPRASTVYGNHLSDDKNRQYALFKEILEIADGLQPNPGSMQQIRQLCQHADSAIQYESERTAEVIGRG